MLVLLLKLPHLEVKTHEQGPTTSGCYEYFFDLGKIAAYDLKSAVESNISWKNIGGNGNVLSSMCCMTTEQKRLEKAA